jgi:hypothetical protein
MPYHILKKIKRPPQVRKQFQHAQIGAFHLPSLKIA